MKVTFKGKPLIPSKYLEAADLQGKRVPVVIESIGYVKLKRENDKDDTKPLFALRGKEKGWVLNTTNLDSIAEVYGHEADKWIGKPVVVYATKVRAFGETKLAIRVDIDETQKLADSAKNAPQKSAPAKAAEEPDHDPDTGEVADEKPAEKTEAATMTMNASATWNDA